MEKLYLIGTANELQAIRLALDHANGYFDAQGNRLPPGDGTTIPPPTLTEDGTVGFMWMPNDQQMVIPWLGQMHNGILIPGSDELLVQTELPAEFQAYLEAWAVFFGPKPAFPEKPDPWPPVDGDTSPPEARATIQVDVQMRDDDGDGTPEPHIDVTVTRPE